MASRRLSSGFSETSLGAGWGRVGLASLGPRLQGLLRPQSCWRVGLAHAHRVPSTAHAAGKSRSPSLWVRKHRNHKTLGDRVKARRETRGRQTLPVCRGRSRRRHPGCQSITDQEQPASWERMKFGGSNFLFSTHCRARTLSTSSQYKHRA